MIGFLVAGLSTVTTVAAPTNSPPSIPSAIRAGFPKRFVQIEPGLLRYPALDPQQFRTKVEDFLAQVGR